MRILSASILATVALSSFSNPAFAQVPHTTSFQGVLLDEGGGPVMDGLYELVFSIYDGESGGEALWTETQELETGGGIFSATLGLVTPLDLAFDVPYWIGTSVDGGEEIPTRIALGSAPYSLRSAAVGPEAVDADGATNGQVLTIGDGVAQWMDPPSGGDGGGGGDITAVTAGEGLSGGAASGAATLALDTGFTDDRYVEEGEANAVTSAMIANGTVAAEDISTSGGSNGQVLTVTGSGAGWQDAGGAEGWSLKGNAGTTSANFIGTTDDHAMEIRANGKRALRIDPGEVGPSIIGGHEANTVDGGVDAGTIAGGGSALSPNLVSKDYGSIGGGLGNLVQGVFGAVAGGSENTADAFATVSGGAQNKAEGNGSSVGGGFQNHASGTYSTVPGGFANVASVQSFAAGTMAQATHSRTFVWADTRSAEPPFASTADEQFLVHARGGIGLNTNAPLATAHVKRSGLSMTSAGILNDDLIVEDGDAVFGLYSNNVGSFGSAIIMAEYSGGTLDNKWGIARNTTTGGNLLRFTFGTGADYSSNNTVVRISTSGNVYADGAFFPGGADVAERVDVAGPLGSSEPGDVLVVSAEANRTFELSLVPYATTVAGVYATKPGVILSESDSEDPVATEIPLAVIGIVPTKVTGENGPIHRGDLLVTSSTPGHAMKADPDRVRIGMVLGKALGNFDGAGTGVIEVLVSLK